MTKAHKPNQPVPAEAIARLADRGEDVSGFFQGSGLMAEPIQRLNADVTASMSEEPDQALQGAKREAAKNRTPDGKPVETNPFQI